MFGNAKQNVRIVIFCVLIILAMGLIVRRLYALQINGNSNYQALANSQQGYTDAIKTTRGIISSSDGIELAINVPLYDVYVYTPNIDNIEEFELHVLPLVHMSVDDFSQDISQGEKYFKLESSISISGKEALVSNISQKDQQALQFVLNEKRSYPNKTLLAQVLGFVDPSNGHGNYGIEGYFDTDLQGVDGKIIGNKDQNGNPIVNANFGIIPPKFGEDLTLTIDANLQSMVETKLAEWVSSEKADGGTLIIMDPQTGAIAALANYPTFDPNSYYNGYLLDCTLDVFKDTQPCKDPKQPETNEMLQQAFSNDAIAFNYEPGSVMKSITASAALDQSKVDLTQQFDDATGVYQANGEKVYNFNKLPAGNMTLGDILKKSSNVGASMVAHLLGKNLLAQYYKAFGIGQLTGITLQGEGSASIPSVDSWKDIDTATASFGQYIAATPLQVIGIYQTLANNGIRMKPYIIKQVRKDGETINTIPQTVGRVVSSQTAHDMTNLLTYTTTGEPAWGLEQAHLQQYMPLIAGKTGSAQIPLPNKAGYYSNGINATYVGYAPAQDPKFVMLALLKNPRAGIYAATTAVPLWADIAKNLFVYYKIPPQ